MQPTRLYRVRHDRWLAVRWLDRYFRRRYILNPLQCFVERATDRVKLDGRRGVYFPAKSHEFVGPEFIGILAPKEKILGPWALFLRSYPSRHR